jgi:hypothetical protein
MHREFGKGFNFKFCNFISGIKIEALRGKYALIFGSEFSPKNFSPREIDRFIF